MKSTSLLMICFQNDGLSTVYYLCFELKGRGSDFQLWTVCNIKVIKALASQGVPPQKSSRPGPWPRSNKSCSVITGMDSFNHKVCQTQTRAK